MAHDDHTLHNCGEKHHHHRHAENSQHPAHHHLLCVEDLSVSFRMYEEDAPFFKARQREVEVLHNLNISVHTGEILAVVGASGSGKTLLADSIMGLYEPNALVTGTIYFDGCEMDGASLTALRGNGISLVPQSVANLDPVMKIGAQIMGPARSRDAEERMRSLLKRYRLDESVCEMYPFQLSGGMLRRVLLCCALMQKPKLIIADEPTPGLDLQLAVDALQHFREFADDGGAVLLITHDIELALQVADRIAVFKDGTVVEETAVANFASPELLESDFAKALWYALPEHAFSGEQDG